jgi:hypothetical protein
MAAMLDHKQNKLMRNLLLTSNKMAAMTSHAAEEYAMDSPMFSLDHTQDSV